jgi:simple sugar transport system permease protein
LVGGDQIQIALGLPAAVAGVLQGAILFFVLGGSIFVNYRIRLIRYEKEALQEPSDGPKPQAPESAAAGGSHD